MSATASICLKISGRPSVLHVHWDMKLNMKIHFPLHMVCLLIIDVNMVNDSIYSFIPIIARHELSLVTTWSTSLVLFLCIAF
jgi:hypothetical protein